MKGSPVVLALLLTLAISPMSAQTRWCSVTGKTAGDALYFPPIARAAHIFGTVIERVTFDPGGSVLQVEPLLGPPLLGKSIAIQLMKWSIVTDTRGGQACQALVIANFAFSEPPSETETWTASSLIKVFIQSSSPVTQATVSTETDHFKFVLFPEIPVSPLFAHRNSEAVELVCKQYAKHRGPTARNITAWGEAPGSARKNEEG